MQAQQLSLWDEPPAKEEPPIVALPDDDPIEPKEAFQRRRIAEMSAKLAWPALTIEPFRRWPGVTILAGEAAWRAYLASDSDGRGLVLIALREQLDPLIRGDIDEAEGLHRRPVECLSQTEERKRKRMMRLAELQDWPRVSWMDRGPSCEIGAGKAAWQEYHDYGAWGWIIGVVDALERRLRGEEEDPGAKPRRLAREVDDEEF